MNKKDAYNEGFCNGYGIADSNIAEINGDLFTDDDLEKFKSDCTDTESDSFRQYSPFEFTAKKINDSRYPDEVWESYDSGVMKGIARRVKEFKKVNKSGFIKL